MNRTAVSGMWDHGVWLWLPSSLLAMLRSDAESQRRADWYGSVRIYEAATPDSRSR